MSTSPESDKDLAELALPPGSLALPVGWVVLAPPGSDASSWADEYLDGLAVQPNPAARAQLHHGLLAVMAVAAQLREGARQSFALVGDPLQGIVRALLSIQMLRVTPDALPNYRERLETAGGRPEVESINRTVEELEVPSGRVVLMHDFTVATEAAAVPEPALERAILGLFVTGADVMIEFSMYTQNLAEFDDMSAYLLAIVGSLDLAGTSS